ncbi:helix-turn-helix domain-containing protein [Enterococcus durans]|uniref:helix-turn-helix domain-containing protein n=1 Tax=Enterococcus durans TaxID=53345 RepID=UPI00189EB3D3|nr:helix-turn-helix domain-containing protein [Enterococcus durans]MBT9719514.1 helix-turn-helix domain-containing protein [Enterococcus durans]MDB1686156.1 helix-turn-helix domain-containing protein [Enterococcus durans]
MRQTNQIALLRKSKGWTQETLAEKSNLSIRTIQRLESGEDSSLETLRLVSNALEVQINDLFSSSEKQSSEINFMSKEQSIQLEKRKAEKQVFNIKALIFYIFILLLAAFIDKLPEDTQVFLGILWIGLFFLGLYVIKYYKAKWVLKMDEKYPLTRGVKLTREKNPDDFLWWKQPVVRTIMMIFWGAIIPLIYILKFGLHLF